MDEELDSTDPATKVKHGTRQPVEDVPSTLPEPPMSERVPLLEDDPVTPPAPAPARPQ